MSAKKPNKSKSSSGRFEDITSSSKPEGVKNGFNFWLKYKFKPFFLRNKKRNLKTLIAIVSCFAVLAGVGAFFYANHLLNKINFNGYSGNADATFADDLDEDLSYSSMYDVTDAESLKELLKGWATNGGEKMKSKNVINVLLMGEDNDDGSHRSDSMILVSLNKKTKKIYLTSFLRDSYTYMNIGGSERYDKTNHSYAWGGPMSTIEVLENNYKIKIDHYVIVDFGSFVKAINAIGGVNVPVTEEEAAYMNRTTHFDDFKSGKSVHLDGEHALIFSRIRYNDSEVNRTDRQKLVITALIKKTKQSSVGQLGNLVDTILPFLTTNYSKREIISLGTQAFAQGWMDYEIIAQTQPEEELREGVEMQTWSYSNLFVWIVDYPMCAMNLQNTIYGTTNIKIDPATHQSALSMLRSSDGSEYDSDYDYTNDYNNDYDSDYNGDGDNQDYDYDYDYDEDKDDYETTTKRRIAPPWFTRRNNEEPTDYEEDPTEEDPGNDESDTPDEPEEPVSENDDSSEEE